MTTQQLPHDYLPKDGSIQPAQVTLLAMQCQSAELDSETGETVYRLGTGRWGNHPLTITVNAAFNAYTVEPRPHCACEDRTALECECELNTCPKCQTVLTAVTTVCEFETCLYDRCPSCTHYRETCFAEDITRKVIALANEYTAHGLDQAMAAVSAVSEVLGAHSGSAPIFPITLAILPKTPGFDTLTGENEDRTWTFRDQSAIVPDSFQNIWLEATDSPATKARFAEALAAAQDTSCQHCGRTYSDAQGDELRSVPCENCGRNACDFEDCWRKCPDLDTAT